MLVRHVIFIGLFGLFGLFVTGCTTTDKQTTQSVASTKTSKKTEVQTEMQVVQDMPELLAFLPEPKPQKPQIQEYRLPHASQETQELIKVYADAYEVPERLVRRVVHRESRGNPKARNGPYWGLMQISYPTAQGMGYQGKPEGLLDAETNLKYAVKYLAGAYLVADGNEPQAVRLYARGFYYDAKAKGLLERTGLRPGPTSILTAFVDE